MTDGRKRTSRVLAGLCLVASGGSVVVAAPTYAEPEIDTVQTRVDRLYREAEQASERYNDARLEMRRAQGRLTAVRAALRGQQRRLDAVRAQVATAVVAQYQGQGLSSTAGLLLSEDPDAFIDRLTTVSAFNDQRSQLMADYVVQEKRLETRQSTARDQLDTIAATKRRLGTEKAEIDDKAAQAQELLDTLEARAAARASRSRARAAAAAAARSAEAGADPGSSAASGSSGSSTAAAAPASGGAAAAVSYAMAQVGNSYVYGAAGPSAFDCSGLTMMAWAQAGVSLPHSSSAQMSSGTPVSQSELQPGDLVFYYSPVSHVGMYIGNGKIVNALNPSSGVGISDVGSMPYSGAVRPG
ncbi:MAG TPA: NlpC/P60 family protein [Nocardioidaceae bacterium]|nr:NlpC/P60 family protein [Nocardioidaceae bacterium]